MLIKQREWRTIIGAIVESSKFIFDKPWGYMADAETFSMCDTVEIDHYQNDQTFDLVCFFHGSSWNCTLKNNCGSILIMDETNASQ